MATDTIPITITPEAAGQAAAYGLRRELDELIEHTRQVIPDLDSIEVTRHVIFEEPELPRIIVTARRHGPPGPEHRQLWRDWLRPIWDRFPTRAYEVIQLDIQYRNDGPRCKDVNS
jgi:hypothetical protein